MRLFVIGAAVVALAMVSGTGSHGSFSSPTAEAGGAKGLIAFIHQVFMQEGGQIPGLYVVQPDGGNRQLVVPGEDIGDPRWSPDGSRIAFLDHNMLKVIDLNSLAVTELLPCVVTASGSSWGAHSKSTYTWSPDSTRMLADLCVGGGLVSLVVKTGETTSIPSGSHGSWHPSNGRIIFVCGSPIVCTSEADGTGRVEMPLPGPWSIVPPPVWSPDASEFLVVQHGKVISVYDSNGENRNVLWGGSPGTSVGSFPAWSPGGSQIAFSGSPYSGCGQTTKIMDAATGDFVYYDEGRPLHQPWSPDGTLLAAAWDGGCFSEGGIYIQLADGSSSIKIVDASDVGATWVWGAAWSPVDVELPPLSNHKVLFINGIGSQSFCGSGFAGEVEWMTDLLSGDTPGYAWVDEFAGIDSPDDFLYYDYTSGSDATETCPDYEPEDTCWSLDDYYNNILLDDIGQTRRLANYIDKILTNPTVTLTLVGFSQGGILAAAAVDSYIGEPNLSRIRSVVTFDSPLQGIPDWAEWGAQAWFDCDGHEFDSPWDMEDDSDYIRAIVNEPHPDVPLFTIDRVGIVDNVPVPDRSSRIPTWEGDEGHAQINTALAQGSHTWGEATVGIPFVRSAEEELREMRLFFVCAVSPATLCETMARLAPGQFEQIDRATTLAAQPVTFSVGTTTQGLSVPSDTSNLTTLVLGDPSYSVALVSPSAAVIDETTVDPNVSVRVLEGAWLFEIASPEVGQWQVKSTAPDLDSLAIFSATTPSPTADQDGDGTRDTADNCVGLYNLGQTDTDGDGLGDACDADDDGDNVLDVADNCPDLPNAAQTDTDGNGRGDVCDLGGYQDWDGDGVVDNDDNCPIDVNTSQTNSDGDILGDTCDPNDDDDACTDVQELGNDETLGGLRDPLNPWDFYDVLGPGAALPIDGVIDLPNDILGVILHFAPQGQAPYDVQFDRGPSAGPNPWNMTAPDGVIDLPNDILGVILQFNHRCV